MRNLGLDLLRIIAVLLVIGRHLRLPKDPGLLQLWQQGGWVGVDLFFVLSGFLVSGLLFQEYRRTGKVSLGRFLIRRGFKIYPAFWLFLITSIAIKFQIGRPMAGEQFVGEFLFLQNYLGGLWSHTWSLAVEEHFYLILALVVAWMLRTGAASPFSSIPKLFAFVAISCLGLRLSNLVLHPNYSHEAYLFGTHLRIDSLAFGTFLSYLWHFDNLEQKLTKVPTWILVSAGVALLSPPFFFQLEKTKWIPTVGLTLFYVGAGLLVLAALRLKSSDNLVLRGLSTLGSASYSIYLWHLPVAVWGYKVIANILGQDNYLLYLSTSVFGACVVGWILNRMIENPVLSLRDKLFPSKST